MTGKVQFKSVALALSAIVLGVAAPLYQPHATQAASAGKPAETTTAMDWAAYNGGVNGDHYSSLSQITPANVARLKQVWRVDVGGGGALQVNPLGQAVSASQSCEHTDVVGAFGSPRQ